MGFFNLETLMNTSYKKLNRFFLFALLFFGLLSPPYLVIFIFFRELFIQLNFINLIFLSISSYFPFFLFNFYVVYYLKKAYNRINDEGDFEEIKFELMDHILTQGTSLSLKIFYVSLLITAIAGDMNIIFLIKTYLQFQLGMFSLTFIYPLIFILEKRIDNEKIFFITKAVIYLGGIWLIMDFGGPLVEELINKIIS
jgi:hypothetical protein